MGSTTPATSICDREPYSRERTTSVWKLGDIIDSTPRIVSSIPLNKYDQIYGDTTYKSFIDNTNYKNRGMVFTGGNDGMLHAFRLGKLELTWTGKTAAEKARLSAIGSTTMGDEAWAIHPEERAAVPQVPQGPRLLPPVLRGPLPVRLRREHRVRLGGPVHPDPHTGQLADGARRRHAVRGGVQQHLHVGAGLRQDPGNGQRILLVLCDGRDRSREPLPAVGVLERRAGVRHYRAGHPPDQRREHLDPRPRPDPQRGMVCRGRVGADRADRQHEQPVPRAVQPEPEVLRAEPQNGSAGPDDRLGDPVRIRRVDDQCGGGLQPRLPGRRRLCWLREEGRDEPATPGPTAASGGSSPRTSRRTTPPGGFSAR